MPAHLHVTIAHVNGPIFKGHVRSLGVPGEEGYLTILKGHEPIVTTLKKGVATIVIAEGEEKQYPIEGGILEVNGHSAIIIV